MPESNSNHRAKRFAILLGIFTILSLAVSAWDLITVRHEQLLVQQLVEQLQGEERQSARDLSNQLLLQSRLTTSLVLSVLAGAIALSVALRGYVSSERNLEDAKVLSSDILASMDAGVITTDLAGKILSVNPTGEQILGLGKESTIQSLSELGEEHSLLNQMQDDIRRDKHPIRDLDYRVQRNGHRKTFRAGCTLLLNRDMREMGLVFQVRDVTEKALIEERLLRMERYMGLGTLAAGLQHEIKNPLNALTLHIQLLSERLQQTEDDPEVNETLEVLNTEVRRIGKVLDGFRSYASIHEIGRSDVDVPSLITKLLRLLRPDADQKGVKLDFTMSPNTNGLIQADPTQLEQILLNLALNATAAMPQGGLLQFSVSEQEDKLRIDVSDTGNGIPPEFHPQLFDPYFTTRFDGTGMGLAICDKLVRQHGGSIDFVSNPNGTVFTVLLPKQVV